jgi:hypothetical protein
MTLTKLVAIALAVLTLTAGAAAAMPGNAPDHAGSNTAEQASAHGPQDGADGNESEVDDADTTEQRRTADHERYGPPVDMPSQVPDHVTQIHDLIRHFLNGGHDGSLGEAISGVMGGGQAANGANGNADAAQRG